MKQPDECCNGSLLCAVLLIVLCATGIGAAASTVDLRVAEVVAVAMKPIA